LKEAGKARTAKKARTVRAVRAEKEEGEAKEEMKEEKEVIKSCRKSESNIVSVESGSFAISEIIFQLKTK